jgi:hypothetical protein
MKSGYRALQSVDQEHNDMHRGAFMQPETLYVTTTLPTIENMKLGEMRTYYDGSDYWLYQKIEKNKLGKIEWAIV